MNLLLTLASVSPKALAVVILHCGAPTHLIGYQTVETDKGVVHQDFGLSAEKYDLFTIIESLGQKGATIHFVETHEDCDLGT